VIAPICAMCVVMGVVPGVFLKPMEPAVKKTVEHVRGSGLPMSTERNQPAKPAVLALTAAPAPAPSPEVPPAVNPAAKEAHR
jgi:NADH-quinone oxidoreductase subunit M